MPGLPPFTLIAVQSKKLYFLIKYKGTFTHSRFSTQSLSHQKKENVEKGKFKSKKFYFKEQN